MKYLLILSIALLAACGGESSEAPQELTEIEICLDQGGEWQGECAFPNEYCLIRSQCKPGAEFCPCAKWALKSDYIKNISITSCK